jgi:Fic family protein
LHQPLSPKDQGKISRLAHHLFLAKTGFDIRGMYAAERIWGQDPKAYAFAITQAIKFGQLTPWLEYMAHTTKLGLQQLLTQLEKESQTVTDTQEHPGELSRRQREILDLVAAPDAHLTNRTVQTHFHISAITASRDLTHLVALGFLYAHGKGRSVYYTRV